MDDKERRSVYRVPYRGLAGHEIGIVLERADGERFDAQILDLSIKGVGARFDGERIPDLARRERVTIEITLSGHEGPLRIPTTVRSAAVKPGMCRAGFEFRGTGFPRQGLAGRVYSWFNRRGSPRAVAGQSIAASIACPEGEPIKGWMIDMSSSGVTIKVRRSDGRTLRVGETRTVLLALVDDPSPVALDAKIQRRESNASDLTLGLEFQPPFDTEAKVRVDRFVVEHLLSQA